MSQDNDDQNKDSNDISTQKRADFYTLQTLSLLKENNRLLQKIYDKIIENNKLLLAICARFHN